MGNVINLYPQPTSGNPNLLFENCMDKYKRALTVGGDEDGNLLAMATSDMKPEDILYIIKLFEHSLLSMPLED